MQHVVSMLSVDRMLAPTQFSHEGVHDDNLKPDIPNRNLIFGLQLRLDCEAKLGNLVSWRSESYVHIRSGGCCD